MPYDRITADRDLSRYELLVIGKGALTPNSPAPDLGGVRRGLRVIVFEQTAKTLEQRLGFRTAEYGFRQVFPRVPDHAAMRGLASPPQLAGSWFASNTLRSVSS